ncbi:MAG TPA: MBL fold metallo-hydrolase [Candidatus Saccharimonadales bacterium]|nr:MBL fold metallo-hydrolase [Candidatus Saccharimonadales bacterium]
MFDIEYKGGNGVVIATKKSELVIDPNLTVVGLKPLVTKGKIELATEERFAINDPEAILNAEGPGEYEVGDFSIQGISAHRHIDNETDEKKSTIYRIEVGDVRIALLGNVAPKLSEDQLEEIGVVDVLILPVGGGGLTLDATSAAAIVRSVDPKVVIPVHYADSTLTYEVPQESLEVFTKELAAPVEKIEGKFKVKGVASLPATLTTLALSIS